MFFSVLCLLCLCTRLFICALWSPAGKGLTAWLSFAVSNCEFVISSLQCYSVLSDILVKNELCIPLERGSNVLSTGEGFICLSPPSKLKIAVLFYSIYKMTILFSAIVVIFIQWPMMIMSRDWASSVSYCSIYIKSLPWDKLLKMQLPPLHKFKCLKLKWSFL